MKNGKWRITGNSIWLISAKFKDTDIV